MSNDKIKDKAQGIMDGLESMEGENKEAKEEKSNKVNTEKNKRANKDKSKRSFMLTKDEIEKIYVLKAKFQDKTLSKIVGEAINLLYNKVNESEE